MSGVDARPNICISLTDALFPPLLEERVMCTLEM